MDYGKMVENIRKELKKYIVDNNLQSLVLGVSGGIDSALCCALAKPVCNELNIPLIGRSITIETNKAEEVDRSERIGNLFCTNFNLVDLTDEFDVVAGGFNKREMDVIATEDDISFKIRYGNIKARMRMIYLYNLSQKTRGLVLSTDNYTELLLGFWTLHGDVGDYGMIQNLWKTEVYEMAGWLAVNELDETHGTALMACVGAVPTDGLGITNSDLDQLGASTYGEVDRILQDYLGGNFLSDDEYKQAKNHPVIQRHLRSQFKRDNPINLSREIIMYGKEL